MQKRTIISTILFVFFLIGCSSNEKTGFTEELKKPALTFLWETDTLLNTIESVIFNEKENILYTTSINGHWLKKNGKGFVSKVQLDGKIELLYWVKGLDGPTGTAIYDNTLYVADFDTIVEIDINRSQIIKKHYVKNSKRLNDLTISENAVLYATGTLAGKLFSLENNEIEEVLHDLGRPNGLLAEKNRILIGTGNPSNLVQMNLTNHKIDLISSDISPDGIAAIGNGDYLVSEWGGRIYYVKKNGERTLLLDKSKDGINSADISYIPSKKMLLVPVMLKNKLMAYRLSDMK